MTSTIGTIIGVDIGTSVTKAVAFDRDGRALHTAARRSTLLRRPGGLVEQDLEEVLESVVEVVRQVAAALPAPPEALALTGQGDGLWLRDADGRATRRMISWMDGRAAPLVGRWQRDGTVAEVFRHTGSGMFPGCHAPLLAWLDEHEPETLKRSAVAGYCVDAIAQRLTGAIGVDASDATLPFLDPVSRAYSPGRSPPAASPLSPGCCPSLRCPAPYWRWIARAPRCSGCPRGCRSPPAPMTCPPAPWAAGCGSPATGS